MLNRLVSPLAFMFAAGIAFAAAAQPPVAPPAAPVQPPAQNIRGTITAFDGMTLSVKTREGQDVKLAVPATQVVSVHKPFTFADIKAGNNIALVTVGRPDGSFIALNIRPLGATVNTSSNPYDLAPGSVMNNAAVVEVVGTGANQTVTVKTPNGNVTARIVPETTMSQTTPGARDDLKVGAKLFATARPDATGKLTVARLEVGKDGIDPGE